MFSTNRIRCGAAFVTLLVVLCGHAPPGVCQRDALDDVNLPGLPIANSGFKQWDGEALKGWVNSRNARLTREETNGGVLTVTIGAPTGLFQEITRPALLEDDTLFVSIPVEAGESEMVYLTADLIYDDDKRLSFRAYHPGDGKWHELRVSGRIPSNNIQKILVGLFIKPEARQPVRLQALKTSVLPAIP